MFFNPHLSTCFYGFLDGEKQRERARNTDVREISIDWLPPIRIEPATFGERNDAPTK